MKKIGTVEELMSQLGYCRSVSNTNASGVLQHRGNVASVVQKDSVILEVTLTDLEENIWGAHPKWQAVKIKGGVREVVWKIRLGEYNGWYLDDLRNDVLLANSDTAVFKFSPYSI